MISSVGKVARIAIGDFFYTFGIIGFEMVFNVANVV